MGSTKKVFEELPGLFCSCVPQGSSAEGPIHQFCKQPKVHFPLVLEVDYTFHLTCIPPDQEFHHGFITAAQAATDLNLSSKLLRSSSNASPLVELSAVTWIRKFSSRRAENPLVCAPPQHPWLHVSQRASEQTGV